MGGGTHGMLRAWVATEVGGGTWVPPPHLSAPLTVRRGPDVAVGAPLGAEDRRGLVFIYSGGGAGLQPNPAQVLRGQWAPGRNPDFFGAALRGDTDLDGNGYPGEELGGRRRRPISPIDLRGRPAPWVPPHRCPIPGVPSASCDSRPHLCHLIVKGSHPTAVPPHR